MTRIPPAKICIITSSHTFRDTRIFEKECRSLARAGFRVTLLAPNDMPPTRIDEILVVGFGKLKRRLDRLVNVFRIADLSMARRYDVYHVHELELLLLAPFIKSFRPKAKFIYDVHENYEDAILSDEKSWIPVWLKPLVAWVINNYEKNLSILCDLVVAAAPDIEQRFQNHRTISIRNFAPLHVIDRVVKKRNVEKNERKGNQVVYTGSMTKSRGLLEVLGALELVDPKYDVTLLATGIYQDADFQRQVEAHPGYRRMKYLGYLPKYENVVDQAMNADIAVICFHPDPNLDTAVERSNKLFEYMAMGLTLVVSNIPAWAGLVEKHQCGVVVNPLDSTDIARGITYLLEHPKVRRKMGANGRQAVEKYYSWEIEGNRLVEAYRRLLDTNH